MVEADTSEQVETLTQEQFCIIIEWMITGGKDQAERRGVLEEQVARIHLVAYTLCQYYGSLEDIRLALYNYFILPPIRAWFSIEYERTHSEINLDQLDNHLDKEHSEGIILKHCSHFSISLEMLQEILFEVYYYKGLGRMACMRFLIERLEYYGYFLYEGIITYARMMWGNMIFDESRNELINQMVSFLGDESSSLPDSLNTAFRRVMDKEIRDRRLIIITLDDIYELACSVLDRITQENPELYLPQYAFEFSRELMRLINLKRLALNISSRQSARQLSYLSSMDT